ncbi:class F sortase, partial [Microbacteriaceae bacterium K1510]|nr:class F sortase [Microbacteriaceae bacterium K1510]
MKPKQLSAVYGAPHLKQFYGPPYKGAILPMHDAVDPEMPAKLNETKQQAAILAKKIPAPIMPTRLQIPAIKLNAIVEPVGILSNGQMGVPKAFDRVGLLAPWTKPGEKGNAVIDGHFDHYTGPAVFYGLRRLKPGDQVIVTGKAGTKLIFAVQ